MSRKKRTSIELSLVLVVCCVLCAIYAASAISPAYSPAAAGTPQPAGPTPSAAAEATPHLHDYDPETGLCRECGFVCEHAAGFDAEHRCLDCRWRCTGESHDENAVCPVCGEELNHHFGMDGICDVCGLEAPLYTEELPDRYFESAEHEGRHFYDTFTAPDGQEHTIAVWLPWNYSEEVKYNVVVLIHGNMGECGDWTDVDEMTHRGEIQFRRVYDRMVEERLCDPFMIVGISFAGFEHPPTGEAILREAILPHVAQSYSTYMRSGSVEDMRAAREHIAIGGLSRGSMFTYSAVMPRCLDLAANFCCFSNGDNPLVYKDLNSEENIGYGIKSYVATLGLMDEEYAIISQRTSYRYICQNVERVTDGENARLFEIAAGHNFITWTASLYDALLLMF